MHDIFLTYVNHNIIIFISIGNKISYTFPNLSETYLLYAIVILFGYVAIGIFKCWKYTVVIQTSNTSENIRYYIVTKERAKIMVFNDLKGYVELLNFTM